MGTPLLCSPDAADMRIKGANLGLWCLAQYLTHSVLTVSSMHLHVKRVEERRRNAEKGY